MPEFVRGANGSVIGIAVAAEEHPDQASDAPGPTSMLPIVPIPENATVGELPDVVTQANALSDANAKIAELEAALADKAPAEPAPSSSTSSAWDPLAGAPAPSATDPSSSSSS